MASRWVRAWNEALERFGATGRVDEAAPAAELEGWIEGFLVRARAFVLRDTLHAADARHTVIEVGARSSDPLELHVACGHVYPLARSLGVRDSIIGHPAFDDRYVVKTSDDALARAWLDDEACAALLATSDAYELEVKRSWLRVSRRGFEDDAESLVVALRGAGQLAGAGARQLERWRRSAAALGGTLTTRNQRWGVDGEVELTLPHRATRVSVDLPFVGLAGRGPPTLWTRASAPRVGLDPDRWVLHERTRRLRATPRLAEPFDPVVDDAAFTARWRCLAEAPQRLAARLPGARLAQLAQVAPAAVLGELGVVSVWLPGFVHDPARLAALVDLTATFAVEIVGATAGPYR